MMELGDDLSSLNNDDDHNGCNSNDDEAATARSGANSTIGNRQPTRNPRNAAGSAVAVTFAIHEFLYRVGDAPAAVTMTASSVHHSNKNNKIAVTVLVMMTVLVGCEMHADDSSTSS